MTRFCGMLICPAILLSTAGSVVQAQLPVTPTVSAGSASVSTVANTMSVNQTSANAVIDWNSFSVGAGNVVNFTQPTATSTVLNRVTGNNVSTIAGQINANGNVIIANPYGTIFANGAVINVGGLTATTLDVSNSQIMSGGSLDFSGTSTASIINNGSITATQGDINLFAAHVENNNSLMSYAGHINLGAGHQVTLNTDGTYTVTGAQGEVKVLNTGSILGSRVMMTAGAGSSAVSFSVEKATMIVKSGGRILLGTAASTIEMASGAAVASTEGTTPSIHWETPQNSDTYLLPVDQDPPQGPGIGQLPLSDPADCVHGLVEIASLSNVGLLPYYYLLEFEGNQFEFEVPPLMVMHEHLICLVPQLNVPGIDLCPMLPFSCYLREHIGPMSFEQMMQSVFGSQYTIELIQEMTGADGFSVIDVVEFTTTGKRPVTLQTTSQVVEFFQTQSPGNYVLYRGAGGRCTTYVHNPDDVNWDETLTLSLQTVSDSKESVL